MEGSYGLYTAHQIEKILDNSSLLSLIILASLKIKLLDEYNPVLIFSFWTP